MATGCWDPKRAAFFMATGCWGPKRAAFFMATGCWGPKRVAFFMATGCWGLKRTAFFMATGCRGLKRAAFCMATGCRGPKRAAFFMATGCAVKNGPPFSCRQPARRKRRAVFHSSWVRGENGGGASRRRKVYPAVRSHVTTRGRASNIRGAALGESWKTMREPLRA